LQDEVEKLRDSMSYSLNNPAGTARNRGIQTQISGIEGRIAAAEVSRDDELSATTAQCDARRDVERKRQAAESQQKAQAKSP